MVRAIKRNILKGWARRKGYPKVNRVFGTIWAEYQRGRWRDDYDRITSRGRGGSNRNRHRNPSEERATANAVTRQSIIKTAFQNIAAKIAGHEPKPAARSGLV